MNQIKSLKKQILIQNLFLIIMFGMILNLCVMVTNDSKMPVLIQEQTNLPNYYLPFTEFNQVNYPYFSDILGNENVLLFSIGDVIIWWGFSLIMISFIYDIFIKFKQRRLNKNGINCSNG